MATLAQAIDSLLPQTQCTRCGYTGCAPYADAVARGDAEINRCGPGGDDTIVALAALTGRAVQAMDPSCATPGPLRVAVIDEARCIGCTLCIAACPVDAIVGAAKRMHAVLPSLCSGCELCVAPCPVDCIVMAPVTRTWSKSDARAARERHDCRAERLGRSERVAERPPAAPAISADATRALPGGIDAARRAAVAAALARARARRAGRAP